MAPHLLRAVGDGTRPSALPGPPEDRAGGRPECRGGGAALSPARGIRRRRNSAPGVGVGVGSASPLTSEGTSPWPQAIGRAWRRSKTRSPGQGLCMVGDGTGQVSGRAAGRGFSGGAPGAPPAPCPAGTASRPLPSPFPEPAGVRGHQDRARARRRVCARQERGGPPAGSHRGPPAYSRPQAGACSVNGAGRVWMALGPTSLTS